MALSTPYDNQVMSDGGANGVLWTFDDAGATLTAYRNGSADSAHDSSSIGTGVLVNQSGAAGALPLPAGINNCVQFPGTSAGHVVAAAGTTPNLNGLGNGPMTLEVWIKSSAAATLVQALLAGSGSGGGGYYYFRGSGSNTLVNGVAQLDAKGSADIYEGDLNITDNAWHHVVLTRDSTSPLSGVYATDVPARICFYVDGAVHNHVGVNPVTTVMGNGSGGITIGGDGGGGEYFTGFIAKPAIYNIQLSSSQVADHYTKGTTTYGQTLRPDADLATTGWSTVPLYSKINDSSDATVITATLA